MGRIRTIKPEFFRSRSLARCPLEARVTFAGLWTEADDHGRGVADPRIIKGALWALDDDVTHLHISAHLNVLTATGHIKLYAVDGETYFEIVKWSQHQAAAYRRGEPKYPAPDGYLETVSEVCVQESAGRMALGAGTGRELEGKTLAEPAAPRKRTPPKNPKGNGLQAVLFDALVNACGLGYPLTKNEGGRVGTAASQLVAVGATADEVAAKASAYRRKFQNAELTPTALASNWSQLSAGAKPKQTDACPLCERSLSSPDHNELCEIFR